MKRLHLGINVIVLLSFWISACSPGIETPTPLPTPREREGVPLDGEESEGVPLDEEESNPLTFTLSEGKGNLDIFSPPTYVRVKLS